MWAVRACPVPVARARTCPGGRQRRLTGLLRRSYAIVAGDMSHDTVQSSGGLHAPRLPSPSGLLQLWAPSGPVQRFIAVEPQVVLGREAPAIAMRDPRVSREHCRVRHDGALWSVEDLGSRNGTYIDGVRVRGSGYAQA